MASKPTEVLKESGTTTAQVVTVPGGAYSFVVNAAASQTAVTLNYYPLGVAADAVPVKLQGSATANVETTADACIEVYLPEGQYTLDGTLLSGTKAWLVPHT